MTQSKGFYAGIGWRKTPDDVLQTMTNFGHLLAEAGYMLRSGAGERADQAWEAGANGEYNRMSGDVARCEIWVPWHGFNGSKGAFLQNGHRFAPVTPRSIVVVKSQVPNWDFLPQGSQKLLNRNCYQIYGECLRMISAVDFTPSERATFSKFAIGYTEEGKRGGGTGMTMKLAEAEGIPVFDLGEKHGLDKLKEFGRTL